MYSTRRVYELLLSKEFEFSEFQGALLALVWGGYILSRSYGSIWEIGSGSPGAWIPWGMVLTALGSIQLTALIVRSGTLRRGASFLAFLVWFAFSALVLQGQATFLIGISAFLFSIAAAWAFWRLRFINGG